MPLDSASGVRAYHDVLMFLVAFADDAGLHRQVGSELERIAARIRKARSSGHQLVQNLMDTGIAGTDVAYVYTLPIAQWLCQTFPADVELAWDDDSVEAVLDELGHVFLPHVEQSSLLTNRLTTRELFELSSGSSQTVLSWIIGKYRAVAPVTASNMCFYDQMGLRLQWRLDDRLASRTFNRFPKRRLSFAAGRAKKKPDLRKQLAVKIPKPKRQSIQQANQLIDVARAALSARLRETEAVTYSNPYEVDLFQLGDGIDVAIYGMAPAQRLSVDSFFGFIAARNGVPVAYGGGFVYLHRLDIGLNIFREHRGGESTFLFSQILSVFCQHYRSTRIIIDSAQFGFGRAGGIKSGAFWFYYKLGFRPIGSELALLAEQEWGKIRAQREYRTPAATLRKFTGSDLLLNLDDSGGRAGPVPDMADISLAVTRDAANHFNGDRTAQTQWAERRVRRLLAVGDIRSWPAMERQSFSRLCTLIALIPDLSTWSDRQKQSLVALMRAKGGQQERRFVLLTQSHRKLASALAELAASVEE